MAATRDILLSLVILALAVCLRHAWVQRLLLATAQRCLPGSGRGGRLTFASPGLVSPGGF